VKINFPFFQCSSSELDSWDGRSISRHDRGCIYSVSVLNLNFLSEFQVSVWMPFYDFHVEYKVSFFYFPVMQL